MALKMNSSHDKAARIIAIVARWLLQEEGDVPLTYGLLLARLAKVIDE